MFTLIKTVASEFVDGFKETINKVEVPVSEQEVERMEDRMANLTPEEMARVDKRDKIVHTGVGIGVGVGAASVVYLIGKAIF